jgi:predicted  nucleic acid-binding Zn-ribbon protein
MARGITQEQVNAAADALVAAGEKPTVEKIRQALGTGSPNTVIRMLDTWRGSLAQRLQEVLTLPNVPPEAGQAFAEVWRLAVSHAEAAARSSLTEEQNVLFAEQTSLTQERKVWEIALAEAQSNVTESVTKLTYTEVQLSERQALVDQLEAQLTDLLQQRDRLQAQVDQQRGELDALRTERVAAQDHVHALEDRAHQAVDHARQEIKSLQQRLEREQREHTRLVAQLTGQCEELRGAMHAAEQAAARQEGKVTALEKALAKWNAPPLINLRVKDKKVVKRAPKSAKQTPRKRSAK